MLGFYRVKNLSCHARWFAIFLSCVLLFSQILALAHQVDHPHHAKTPACATYQMMEGKKLKALAGAVIVILFLSLKPILLVRVFFSQIIPLHIHQARAPPPYLLS